MDPRYVRRLPPYVYLQDLVRGRRVLEIGCGEGHSAHFLLQAGAKSVTGVDKTARAVDAAKARYRVADLDFRVADYGGLELEDRSFDVVCVPSAGELVRWIGFLEEVRRVLTREGFAMVAASSADRADAKGGVSYHELADRLEPLFGKVRMVGVSPFVGFSLVEFGDDAAEVLEIDLDTQLANMEGGDGGITDYVALAGRLDGEARGFTVVQLPVHGGLEAASSAVGGERRADAGTGPAVGGVGEGRAKEAEALAADALSRLREVEAELHGLRRQVGRNEESDLRRRLARAVEERAAAEAQVTALRSRVGEADAELGGVAAAAAVEIAKARSEAAASAARVTQLEAILASGKRDELALRAELDAHSALEALQTSPHVRVGTPPPQSGALQTITGMPVPTPVPVVTVSPSITNVDQELSRLRAQLAKAQAEKDELSARLNELELRVGLDDVAAVARAEASTGGPGLREVHAEATATGAASVSIELLHEAATRHEQALIEVRAEIDERDAYIEELRNEQQQQETLLQMAAAAARDAHAHATGIEAELREVRVRMARAEGEMLKLRLTGEAPPPVPAAPAAVAVVVPDAGVEARIAELERALADRADAADKATVKWKAAETKTDELWRKVGEMQRELEQNREAGVETARAQRQAAQVALTRAVEEASRKLVSCQDQLVRTEKERAALEGLTGELKAKLAEAARHATADTAALAQQLADAEQQSDTLEQSLGELKERLVLADQARGAAEQARNDLVRDLDESRGGFELAQQQLGDAQRELGEVRRELDEARTAVQAAAAAAAAQARVVVAAAPAVADGKPPVSGAAGELERELAGLRGRLEAALRARDQAMTAREEEVEAIQRERDTTVAKVRGELELMHAAAARRKQAEAVLLARIDELEQRLAELEGGLRQEEQRLGELEDNLRVVHQHTALVPDSQQLERELVDRAAHEKAQAEEIANRDQKLRTLAAELGQRDAELALLHTRVATAERQVGDVIEAVRKTREQLAGRSPVEIAAMLDRLAAEAGESRT